MSFFKEIEKDKDLRYHLLNVRYFLRFRINIIIEIHDMVCVEISIESYLILIELLN